VVLRPWLRAAFAGLLLCIMSGVWLCHVLCCVWVGGSGSGEEGPSGGSERSDLFTTALWTPAPVHNMLLHIGQVLALPSQVSKQALWK
jgi:hypothetical protein